MTDSRMDHQSQSSSEGGSLVSHQAPNHSTSWNGGFAASGGYIMPPSSIPMMSNDSHASLQQRLEAHLQFLEEEAIRVQRQLQQSQLAAEGGPIVSPDAPLARSIAAHPSQVPLHAMPPQQSSYYPLGSMPPPASLPYRLQPQQPTQQSSLYLQQQKQYQQRYDQQRYDQQQQQQQQVSQPQHDPQQIHHNKRFNSSRTREYAPSSNHETQSYSSNSVPPLTHSPSPTVDTSLRSHTHTSHHYAAEPRQVNQRSSRAQGPSQVAAAISVPARLPIGNNMAHNNSGASTASSGNKSRADSSGNDSSSPASNNMQCGACRRKKRTCDGNTPTCSRCKQLDIRCVYPNQATKRGPAPGVVTHLRGAVHQLQEQIQALKEKESKQQQLRSSLDSVHHKAIRSFLAHLPSTRDQSYLHAYFFQLNNSLFPFLDRQEFAAEHARYLHDQSVEPPLAWMFQYSCSVAIGACISGDASYAKNAITVARIISCAMFDTPTYDVIRSFLLLSFYLIAQHQHRRASCCLAIAKRMLFLVPMFHAETITKMNPEGIDKPPVKLTKSEHGRLHEQLKMLCEFLENMLVSTAWWKNGYHDSTAVPTTAMHAEKEDSNLSSPNFTAHAEKRRRDMHTSNSYDSSNSDTLLQWPDLLVNPSTTKLHDPDPAAELTSSSFAVEQPQAMEPQRTSSKPNNNGEFKYNGLDFTKIRGGNPGLFEFNQSPIQASTSLFEVHEPLNEIQVVDLRVQILEKYQQSLEMKSNSATGSSGGAKSASSNSPTTDTTNQSHKKRKASSQEDGQDSTPSYSTNSSMSSNGTDMQLSLMRVMCTLSSIKGNMSAMKHDRNIAFRLHQCIAVLSESDRKLQQQQFTTTTPVLTTIRALILCMRTVSLKLLSVINTGDDRIFQQIESAAKQTSLLTQQVDLSFCPMFAGFFHVVSQCHLNNAVAIAQNALMTRTPPSLSSSLRYLLLDLQYHERLALRWEFSRPIFQNLQQRIRNLITKVFGSLHSRAVAGVIDPNLVSLLNLNIPVVNPSGVNSNQVGGSLATMETTTRLGFLTELSPFVAASNVNFHKTSGMLITDFVGNLQPQDSTEPQVFEGTPVASAATSMQQHESLVLPTISKPFHHSSKRPHNAAPPQPSFDAAAPSAQAISSGTEPPRKRHQTHPPNTLMQSHHNVSTATASPHIQPSTASFTYSSVNEQSSAARDFTAKASSPLFPENAYSARFPRYMEPVDLNESNEGVPLGEPAPTPLNSQPTFGLTDIQLAIQPSPEPNIGLPLSSSTNDHALTASSWNPQQHIPSRSASRLGLRDDSATPFAVSGNIIQTPGASHSNVNQSMDLFLNDNY